MTNKSYAITMSLLRIGLLGGQIAVGPSAAAQPALAAARAHGLGRGDRAQAQRLPGVRGGKAAIYVLGKSGYLFMRSTASRRLAGRVSRA
jgi:hypothetical protein